VITVFRPRYLPAFFPAWMPCRSRSFHLSFSKVAIAVRLVAINLLTAISLEYGKSKDMNVTDFLKSFSCSFKKSKMVLLRRSILEMNNKSLSFNSLSIRLWETGCSRIGPAADSISRRIFPLGTPCSSNSYF